MSSTEAPGAANSERLVQLATRWAEGRPDIAALVQIGSTVQPFGYADEWSDVDFQLITSRPRDYADPGFAEEIQKGAVAHCKAAFGGVIKATVILADGGELDFAVVPVFDIRVAFAALRMPAMQHWGPARLRAGVRDLRVVAGLGWSVRKGGLSWEKRYSRLEPEPWPPAMTAREHAALQAEFLTALAWVRKKMSRGENLAAQRETHRVLVEAFARMAEEEARIAGAHVRPELRMAERWMSPESLAALPGPGEELRGAVDKLAVRHQAISAIVAQQRGFGRLPSASPSSRRAKT